MTTGISPMAFELETERLVLNMWEESSSQGRRPAQGRSRPSAAR